MLSCVQNSGAWVCQLTTAPRHSGPRRETPALALEAWLSQHAAQLTRASATEARHWTPDADAAAAPEAAGSEASTQPASQHEALAFAAAAVERKRHADAATSRRQRSRPRGPQGAGDGDEDQEAAPLGGESAGLEDTHADQANAHEQGDEGMGLNSGGAQLEQSHAGFQHGGEEQDASGDTGAELEDGGGDAHNEKDEAPEIPGAEAAVVPAPAGEAAAAGGRAPVVDPGQIWSPTAAD